MRPLGVGHPKVPRVDRSLLVHPSTVSPKLSNQVTRPNPNQASPESGNHNPPTNGVDIADRIVEPADVQLPCPARWQGKKPLNTPNIGLSHPTGNTPRDKDMPGRHRGKRDNNRRVGDGGHLGRLGDKPLGEETGRNTTEPNHAVRPPNSEKSFLPDGGSEHGDRHSPAGDPAKVSGVRPTKHSKRSGDFTVKRPIAVNPSQSG
jgi:hypothetical protein